MSIYLRGGGGPRLIGIAPEDIGKGKSLTKPVHSVDRISHVDAAPKLKATKAERLREEVRATLSSAREFAESKPTRKGLREYFAQRIKELNDGD